MAKKTFNEYMQHYAEEHTKFGTKLTHVIGIPMIVVSILLLPFNWRLGLALFVVGWIIQFIGHRIEGNKPAFFADPLYLLVGVVWAGKELVEWVTPRRSA